jgi:hypothetical protein
LPLLRRGKREVLFLTGRPGGWFRIVLKKDVARQASLYISARSSSPHRSGPLGK